MIKLVQILEPVPEDSTLELQKKGTILDLASDLASGMARKNDASYTPRNVRFVLLQNIVNLNNTLIQMMYIFATILLISTKLCLEKNA